MFRQILFAGFAVMAPLSGAAAGEKTNHLAEWSAWVEAMDADYATERKAVLKASDVVYLEAGETAWLTLDDDVVGLTVKKDSDALFSISYDGKKAMLTRGGTMFDLGAFLKDAPRYPVSENIDLGGGATAVGPGETGMRLIIFDQNADAAKNFTGLDWFGYDGAYRFETPFKPAKKMTPETVETERGLAKRYFLAGHASVKIDGREIEFPLYSPTDDREKISYLFTSFTDETSGSETYGVGRYIEVNDIEDFPPKNVTLDFNRSYNPYCARSPHYNCPLALMHLPVALKVGEKSPPEKTAD